VQIITPDAYPQMLPRGRKAQALRTLRAPETAARARRAIEASVPALRGAILNYVAEMEIARGDMVRIYETVHEVRNFAATAGMASTGRIADILCRYLDDMTRLSQQPDKAVVTLHVSAIARAAHADDGSGQVGDMVAAELSLLVRRKLAEANRQ
jgi:hypothetical protein